MEHVEIERDRGRFLYASDDYEACRKVLFGVPMDFTVSGRPGSRSGPSRIREASELIEWYSPIADRSLDEVPFFDGGDVVAPFGNVVKSLENTEKACKSILKDGKVPITLGGEHLISLPLILSVADVYKDLAVIHFDAHTDLRDEFIGEELSHATVMKKVADRIGMRNLWQFGIRSGTREEFRLMREQGHLFTDELFSASGRAEVAQKVRSALGARPVYISLDIDVLDPAFAPGTGTPEPGGLSFYDLMDLIGRIRGLNVVGFDLVEVLPAEDEGQRTVIAAAKLVREFILLFN